jgi:hypothetical protein
MGTAQAVTVRITEETLPEILLEVQTTKLDALNRAKRKFGIGLLCSE